METRLRVLFLTVALSLSGCAMFHGRHHDSDKQADSSQAEADSSAPGASPAGGEDAPPRVIQPDVERRKIVVPHIRSEDIELGGYVGTLNIEDFGAHPVYGFQAGYHLTEDFFVQAEAGLSRAGRTSFETLSNVNLLTDSERRYRYYDVSLGYNFLPGEVFLGSSRAMTTSFFLLAGVGSTNFAGDSKFTGNFGAGFKVLPLDWLAVHVAVEDRVFNTDLLGVNKLDSNLEAHLGFTVFF